MLKNISGGINTSEMQKLEIENVTRYYSPSGSGSETPYSDQSLYRGESSSAGSHYQEDQKYVEITIEMNDDSAFVHDIKPFKYEDPGKSLLGQGRSGRKSNSVLKRIASSLPSDLKRVVSFASPSSSASKSPRPPLARFRRPTYTTEQALKGLKFITKTTGVAGWLEVDKRFQDITKTSNGFLHRSKFGVCVGIDSTDFAEALFDALARKGNITGDTITKGELEDFWTQITDDNFFSRLRIFFAMVDKDADGRLNEDEVREIITLSASANKLENIKSEAHENAALIMETLDLYNVGYITIEDFEVLLLEASTEKTRNEESKDLSKMVSQQLKSSQNWNLGKHVYKGIKYFVLDNWKRVWVMALWICVMAGLFTWKFMEYRKRSAHQVMGVCVCIAKGAGETLKLNMAMILLPVCRNTITWLRTKTKLGVVVPFNDSLNFHKVIATAISIGVGIHATTHLACDFPRLLAADAETYKPMEQYFGVQAKSYGDFLKSVEVLTGTGMVILMTIAFTLATPWFRENKIESLPQPLKKITGFNSFWYTHHLFIIVYSLLVVHGYYVYLIKTWYRKTTWMYLMVPGVIYLSERLIRVLRSSIEDVSMLKVAVLPGNLLSLQMSRPKNFRYKSGQYMYLKCSAVSPLEWHPFSITSAPGDDHLSVHIRAIGDWTKELLLKFSEVCEKRLNRAEPRLLNNIPNFPKILIDGPYGAPSQDYKNFEVVLLVGLGIGATPMISIVKDIFNNLKGNEDEEGRGSNRNHHMVTPPARRSEIFRTKRAYFYWSTKEQGTLDWFKSVMDEVAETHCNNVIELHNYCTGIYEAADARSTLIKMLQSLNHAKNGRDVVSGTRVIANFARPNWRSVYKRIAVKHPNTRVGVFYCGKATAVKELHDLAMDFSRNTSTKFCFHKEIS